MTNEIKPCPYCGHTPLDIMDFLHPTGQGWRDDDLGEHGLTRHYMRMNDPRGVHGQCWELGCLVHEGGCGATMHGDSRDEVIANWNRRSAKSFANGFPDLSYEIAVRFALMLQQHGGLHDGNYTGSLNFAINLGKVQYISDVKIVKSSGFDPKGLQAGWPLPESAK